MASLSDRVVKLYQVFQIEGVTRADLIKIGRYTEEEALRMTDDDMEYVAFELRHQLPTFRNGPWQDVRIAVDKAVELRENWKRRTP